MKKYILGFIVGALAFTGTSVIAAPNGGPFQALQDAIGFLQEQIDNIELLPGPPGPTPPTGAGDIAFIDGDSNTVLKTDGTEWRFFGSWVQCVACTVPISTNDIVAWEGGKLFLDTSGDLWHFTGVWTNVGAP